MFRDVQITVNRTSWPADQTPPPPLLNLAGWTQISVLHTLIHTALWTRPPVIQGFHLSDYWAWLRYGPALACTTDLRLCPEWKDVDPHQKTLLSDEFGVGATTSLLAVGLNCREFVDALYVLRTLMPGQFTLRRASKHGPSKSPDYIGTDDRDRFIILECKGTQSSRRSLVDAIARGIPQKQNLRSRRGTQIYLSLVGGLFIPQSNSSETALIHFADPWWEEIMSVFERFKPGAVKVAVMQIHLAKLFALSGMPRTAEALANTPLPKLRQLPTEAIDELRSNEDSLETERIIFDTLYSDELMSIPRARFSITLPKGLIAELVESNDLPKTILRLTKETPNQHWVHALQRSVASVTSPYGYKVSLIYGNNQAPNKASQL
jgi:hypothetical protein